MRPRNQCGPCGLDFTSVKAFDAHRVGKHAYTYSEGLRMEPMREDGRRCLGPEELLALKDPMAQDENGRWYIVEQVQRARSAFGPSRRTPSGGATGVPGTPEPKSASGASHT